MAKRTCRWSAKEPSNAIRRRSNRPCSRS
jgi:hypothetical protein